MHAQSFRHSRVPSALLGDKPLAQPGADWTAGPSARPPAQQLAQLRISPEHSRSLYQAVNSPCKLIYSFKTHISRYIDCTTIADALDEQSYLNAMVAYMHTLNNKTT